MSQEVTLWIFGVANVSLIAIIGALFRKLSEHERECRERWEKLMDEHGKLKADSESHEREISRMRTSQHDLRDKLPEIVRDLIRYTR